jgi:citrate synthase
MRVLPPAVTAVLPAIAATGASPLDGLRTALSLLAASEGMRPSLDLDRGALRADAMRLAATVPTIVAALHRLSRGLEPVEPRADLGHVANYLYMLSGEEPDHELVRPVEQYMILTIDHGLNASTFTARVVTSTGADAGSAVVAAVGALSGPLHGGAPSRALDTIDAIGRPERAEEWIRDAVTRGEKIMGFGHRVYRTDDPRSTMMRDIARRLGGPLVPLAEHIEETVLAVLEEMKPGHTLRTNVEFYAGVVMDRCGLPRELFTPTFTASRCIGWCAHILEQAADNRIIRPSARYVGPPPPQPVPSI